MYIVHCTFVQTAIVTEFMLARTTHCKTNRVALMCFLLLLLLFTYALRLHFDENSRNNLCSHYGIRLFLLHIFEAVDSRMAFIACFYPIHSISIIIRIAQHIIAKHLLCVFMPSNMPYFLQHAYIHVLAGV